MDDEVIDLTASYTLNNHGRLENLIIEIEDSPAPKRNYGPRRSQRLSKSTSSREKTKASVVTTTPNKQVESSKGFGDCPVCWDKLGINSLASTRCGHVFCLKCIELVALQTKQCPTCRCALKGKSGYHPLYISLQ